MIEILKRGRAYDYHAITADRVDSWAQQYAVEHGLDPAAVMRRLATGISGICVGFEASWEVHWVCCAV